MVSINLKHRGQKRRQANGCLEGFTTGVALHDRRIVDVRVTSLPIMCLSVCPDCPTLLDRCRAGVKSRSAPGSRER